MNPIAQILANLKDGSVVKGRTLKAALKALQRAFPIQGENIRLREYPDGTVIAALPGATEDTCPLEGVAAGDTFRLTTGGLIGGLIAENLFDGAGNLPSFTSLATGWSWFVGLCTSSNGRMTNVEFDLTTVQPPVITPTDVLPPPPSPFPSTPSTTTGPPPPPTASGGVATSTSDPAASTSASTPPPVAPTHSFTPGPGR